jgi:hypothetical protein
MHWNDVSVLLETTTPTTPTNQPGATDETMRLVNEVLEDFRNGPCRSAIDRLVAFLAAVNENPQDATDAYLEYFAPDPANGREIIEKLGNNATFGDLAEAVKNGSIQ